MDATSKPPHPGSVVARRFVLRALAGRGGMGEVWRARDEESGEDVALKLLHTDATSLDYERFAREARIMSEIRHPRIVSYVAHGTCEEYGPFLTMQWLEGEDLAKRLARGPLSTGEALLVLRRISEPLGALHAQGVVHRDLKPSNVLLVKGDIDQATIVDLGIARLMGPPSHITAAGKCIGTPEYMSPEQIRNDRPLRPSSDVFSLGCILFECLAGQRPFSSPDPVSVLAKILFESPPSLLSLRPGVPRAVDALVRRMLEKEPEKRPPNAAVLLAELSASFHWEASRGAFSPTIARDTPELVSVLFVKGARGSDDAGLQEILEMLAQHGAIPHEGPRGELVATFSRIGSGATDQATTAARAALKLASHFPEATLALATGLALVGSDWGLGRSSAEPSAAPSSTRPVGEAFSRAREAALSSGAPRGTVTICPLTTSLLDSRFFTTRVGPFLCLSEDPGRRSSVRPMLASATPFMGRGRELSVLLGAFDDCKRGPSSRAFVVTAPEGMGKSRLLEEFANRLSEPSPDGPAEEALFLVGRGEPLGRTRAYAMIIDVVTTVVTRTGSDGRNPKLLELGALAKRAFENDRAGAAGFVDGRLTRGQLERVFLDFLAIACAACPVVLAIDDAHHVDAPSLELVARALVELSDRPLLVIALGLPELFDGHPALFGSRAQPMELSPLDKGIAEKIARAALGPHISGDAISEIVERAAGNAFFLEELVRAHAEGEGAPGSLVAMIQARLGRLSPESRRVLVAASVFGAGFSRDGVLALLDDEASPRAVDGALEALVSAKLIERRTQSRGLGRGSARTSAAPSTNDVEYGFRHALVREACRGLLGEDELALGHARAAAFLEEQGFEDAAMLAEHWQRGGEPSRARMLHVRAARAAFETNDLEGTRAHAAQAEALGAEGTELGLVRAMTAYALFWNRDWEKSCEVGLAALPLLPRGSSWSCRVLGLICLLTGVGIREELFPAYFEELVATNPDVEATSAYAESIGRILSVVAMRLDRERSRRAHARLCETLDVRGAVDATAHGWARFAMYGYGRVSTHEPAGLVLTIEDAARAFEESGDERMRAISLGNVGEALSSLGRNDEAEAQIREATSIAVATGERYASMITRLLLAAHLATRPEPKKLAEAREIALSLLSDGRLDPFDAGHARGVVARVALEEGKHEEALSHADLALEMMPRLGVRRLSAQTTRIRALARLGRVAMAASFADELLAMLAEAQLETVGAWDVDVHTAAAEAFLLAGRTPDFEVELRAALSALAQDLADVPDPEEQARLLRDVPENALAVRMSREHFGAAVWPTD